MALSLVFSFVVSLLRFTSSGQDRAEGKGEGEGGGGARRAAYRPTGARVGQWTGTGKVCILS